YVSRSSVERQGLLETDQRIQCLRLHSVWQSCPQPGEVLRGEEVRRDREILNVGQAAEGLDSAVANALGVEAEAPQLSQSRDRVQGLEGRVSPDRVAEDDFLQRGAVSQVGQLMESREILEAQRCE